FEAGAAGGKFVDGTDPADAVYTAGKVGIGTTTPSGKLTIKGDDAVQVIEDSNGDSMLGIYYRTPNTTVPNLYIAGTSTSNARALSPQISFNRNTTNQGFELFLDGGVDPEVPVEQQTGVVFINNHSGPNARTAIQTETGGTVSIGGIGNNNGGYRRELRNFSVNSDDLTLSGRVKIQEIRDYQNSSNQSSMALSFPDVTTAGILPPRLTTSQMQALAPIPGLMVYNLNVNCLMYFDGTEWRCDKNGTTISSNINPSTLGSTILPEITECLDKVISVSGCASVPNATINDDPVTTLGIEYNWADGMASMGFTDRALVEIGGQCWFRYNSIATPSNYPDLPNTGANIWNSEVDLVPGTYKANDASWGYYNTVQTNGSLGWSTTPATLGDGLLYQFKAAMNGATQERAQGVCPTGFHVPSDCEFMKLETHLGMSAIDSHLNGVTLQRGTDSDVGTKLRGLGGNFNGLLNKTGFNGNLPGYRVNATSQLTFNGRNIFVAYTTSTKSGISYFARVLISNQKDVRRPIYSRVASSLRCLKD
ncbi:FISUMP domain-containing protein, partial [Flavobacterium proteolyticum]